MLRENRCCHRLITRNCSCVKYTPLAEKTEVPGGGKPGTQRIQRLGRDVAVKAVRLRNKARIFPLVSTLETANTSAPNSTLLVSICSQREPMKWSSSTGTKKPIGLG